MPSTLTTARRSLARLGDRGRTTRIPDETRNLVLVYVNEARSAGETWRSIGEQLGLSPTILHRWCRAAQRPSKLVAVKITDAETVAPSSGLALVTPQGERLEGLDVDSAVRILRALR